YDQNWLPGALFGTLHEAGHGMYDQGLRTQWYGLPPGTFVSLGIHESQSRLWENQVGRSLEFWQWCFDDARRILGSSLNGVDLESFHFAVNNVRPSFIRVEADEATYNLHIMIRFELEQQMIDGDLNVDRLPDAWADLYQQYLGITPDRPADGVLQDIHWSAGLMGYFPTYTLGNLSAAQLFDAAGRAIEDLPRQIARGQFAPLLEWLQTNVHAPGRNLSPDELIQQATGSALSHDCLLRHLREKYHRLYQLT
ncbi:MAG: carboxypeptidase M32, partial [Planctomycetota bacterium]